MNTPICIDPEVYIDPEKGQVDRVYLYGVEDLWLNQTDFDNFDPMAGVSARTRSGVNVPVIVTPVAETSFEKVYSYVATSDEGQTASKTRTITLWGDPTITAPDDEIYVRDPWTVMKDVTAIDFAGNDITSQVYVSGTYDTYTAGTYTLTYTVNSNGFTDTKTRTLTVLPWDYPTLTVPARTVLELDDPFDPMTGVSAEDYEGTDLTASIVHTGTVDTSAPGLYSVYYEVTDRRGWTSRATQVVEVSPSPYATYLFTDGELVINARKDALTALEAVHGAMTNEYEPGYYNFNTANDQPWKSERLKIKSASFGSPYEPESLACTFAGCRNMESVNLNNVNSIGCTDFHGMFEECMKLKEVAATRFDTRNATDLSRMFLDCWELKEIDVSSFDTRNVQNFNAMFYDCVECRVIYASPAFVIPTGATTSNMFSICQNLTGGEGTEYNSARQDGNMAHIDLYDTNPGYFTDKTKLLTTLYNDGTLVINETYVQRQTTNKLIHGGIKHQYSPTTAENNWRHNWNNNANVLKAQFANNVKPTSMKEWFKGCTNLTEIDWNRLDSSDCTDMSSLFSSCSSLTTCDLSKLNTSKVTDFSGIFYSMKPFTGFMNYVNNWDTSAGTNFAAMFMGIKGMASIKPTFDTSNGTSMSSMFGYMDVPVIDISEMDMTNVIDTPFMFGQNPSLTTIYSQEDFALNPNCNAINMFNGSRNIVGGLGTTVTLVDGTYAKVDGYQGTPGYFTYLRTHSTVYYSDRTLIINERSSKRAMNISIHGAAVEEWDVEDYVLNSSSDQPWANYQSVIRTVQVDSVIRPTSTAHWFENFGNCTEFDLGQLNTSNTTSMKRMFRNCGLVTSLFVNGFDTSKVTDMSEMFNDCQKLQEIINIDWDTSKVTTASAMCYNCYELERIDTKFLDFSECTSMYYMFANCRRLSALECSNFNPVKVADFQGMFMGCQELISLDISGWTTPAAQYMSQMFKECRKLEAVDTSGFDTSNVESLEDMFDNCKVLRSLNLRSFDTSNCRNTINMFRNCNELGTIYSNDFSNTIIQSYDMFWNCSALQGSSYTSYRSDKTDKEYARIDNPPDRPGYFTP